MRFTMLKLFLVVIVALKISPIYCYSQFLRVVPNWGVIQDTTTVMGIDGERNFFITRDTTVWISPSVGLDFFVRESKTGSYKAGIIPGVGYGIKWKPKQMKTGYLLGIDIFVQASLSDELDTNTGPEYFNIDVLPVLTVYNWFGVGYGPRFKIGLKDIDSETRSVFSFGLRKTI